MCTGNLKEEKKYSEVPWVASERLDEIKQCVCDIFFFFTARALALIKHARLQGPKKMPSFILYSKKKKNTKKCTFKSLFFISLIYFRGGVKIS